MDPKEEDMMSCVGLSWGSGAVQPPAGHLDPTKNQTYEVIDSVLKDLAYYFPDEIVHMGGDEIIQGCFSHKPSIDEWVKNEGPYNNVHSVGDLAQYFRVRQRDLLDKDKVAMYWDQGSA